MFDYLYSSMCLNIGVNAFVNVIIDNVKKVFKIENFKIIMKKKRIRKEHLITYLFIFILIGASVWSLHFINVQFTGFAVYEAFDQISFDEGTYLNTKYNGSAVVLVGENLSGTYTSKVFDAGAEATWDNLGSINREVTWVFNSYLASAVHLEDNVSEVLVLDEIYYLADMKKSSRNFYLNFSNDLINGSILKLYAKQNKGSTIGIYALSDDLGEEPFGSLTVTSMTGEWHNVTLDIETPTNAIWIGEGRDSGINPKDKFDYIYAEISNNANLSFQVRNCSSSDCSDGTWQSVDLNSINLVGEYFQYRINFTSSDSSITPLVESVTIDYDLINQAPTIELVKPQNQLYFSNESLLINFSVSDANGNLDSCWYSINSGANMALVGCLNTTFNVEGDGSFTLVIYANDTNGEESSDEVSFDVDSTTGVSVSITEPTGEKTTRTGIPLTFIIVGENLTCWYNVKTPIGESIIENTTLADCNDSSFDVFADGDYVLNLYANNTLGFSDFGFSSFLVDTSGETVVISSEGDSGRSSSRTTIIILNGTTELIVDEIQDLIVNPEDMKKIKWSVKNNGTNFLNDCKFKGEGGYASWVFSDEIKNLTSGEEYEVGFDLNIPAIVDAGEYVLTVSLICQEISKSSNFVVEIIAKKLVFDLLKVERVKEDQMRIIYSLEEFSNLEQEIGVQFLFFNPNDEKVAEVREIKKVPANSKQEFEILIPIDSSLEGELNLLVNLNAEDYSTFVQENIILGAPVTGFAFFGEEGNTDNILSFIFVILFLAFSFFIVRRILKHKKKK